MKKILSKSFLLSGLLYFNIGCTYLGFYNNQPICMVSHDDNLKRTFDRFGLRYQDVDSIKNDDCLYILSDVNSLDASNLPRYYIVNQTSDLSKGSLTDDYLNKLSKAVAVWDCNLQNIALYKNQVHNYYYFPQDYEYADPVILPCFLPTEALDTYKEILVHSNKKNHDISSHLPVIFVHSYLQNPRLMFEVGVSSGQSTYSFYRVSRLRNARLIGVDLVGQWAASYAQYNDSRLKFVGMSDLDFPKYYKAQKEFKNEQADLIFIDTSHMYDHTVAEIKAFLPMLSEEGMLLFHDTNMSPLPGYGWACINGDICYKGHDNKKGVIRAIRDCFSIPLDETKYVNTEFVHNNVTWKLIHYPFCNGLTLMKKVRS